MGKKSSEKRQRRNSQAEQTRLMSFLERAPPSAEVLTVLQGVTNPLVAVTFLLSSHAMSRAMGFVAERFDRGLRLIVTCRHGLEDFSSGSVYLAMKNSGVTILSMVGDPIHDPQPGSDISFLMVRDPRDAATRPFLVGSVDYTVGNPSALYNASNRCELGGAYFVDVKRQAASLLGYEVYYNWPSPKTHRVSVADARRREDLERGGWHRCRALRMVSRPGCSGSPVWDDRLDLYGMVVRGSEPGNPGYAEDGDVAIIIPTSELSRARQRVEAVVRERLAAGT